MPMPEMRVMPHVHTTSVLGSSSGMHEDWKCLVSSNGNDHASHLVLVTLHLFSFFPMLDMPMYIPASSRLQYE